MTYFDLSRMLFFLWREGWVGDDDYTQIALKRWAVGPSAADFERRGYTGPWLKSADRNVPYMEYPLVNIQKAIENGHRNSGFSHSTW